MSWTRASNYPRRQQYRRLSCAAIAAMVSGATVLLALTVASAGAASAAGALLMLALGLGLYARHWLSLADRSRVGARSEDEVRRALVPLQAEGWRLRHSLNWRGPGDIDSLVVAPDGIAFVVETKTRWYDDRPARSSARAGVVAVAPSSAVLSARRRAGGVRGPRAAGAAC